ncbi:MAG: hypothetical protein IPH42_16400 [Bacteroidetes bacterium]|nr:hypothetical protein [Bacteroidota bacterium]
MAENFDPRKFMLLAIEEMKKSIAEPRNDKASPKVGAILIDPEGEVLGAAHRGEIRKGIMLNILYLTESSGIRM